MSDIPIRMRLMFGEQSGIIEKVASLKHNKKLQLLACLEIIDTYARSKPGNYFQVQPHPLREKETLLRLVLSEGNESIEVDFTIEDFT